LAVKSLGVKNLAVGSLGDADTALVVADLRNEVRLRDRAIRDLEEEKRTVERVAQRQTRALVNAGGGERYASGDWELGCC
jgi:predicted polyphosphate/ATP-dependent NAD kinase